MIKGIKVMIDGEEFQVPFDLNNMYFNLLNLSKQTPPPQAPPQPQTIRKIVICQDIEVRKAVLGMDKRIIELEKQLKEMSQSKKRSAIKTDKKEVPPKESYTKKVIKKKFVNTNKTKSIKKIKKIPKK